MYFPASHLSHSPSLAPAQRVSEYSPLLSFPHHLDALGGLVSSPSQSEWPASSPFSVYAKLFSLLLLAVLVLVLTGFFLFYKQGDGDGD